MIGSVSIAMHRSQIQLSITIAIVSLIIDSYDSFQMMSCSPFFLIEKCLSCSPLSFLFIVLESRNNTVLLFKLFAVAYCHCVKFVKNTQKQGDWKGGKCMTVITKK